MSVRDLIESFLVGLDAMKVRLGFCGDEVVEILAVAVAHGADADFADEIIVFGKREFLPLRDEEHQRVRGERVRVGRVLFTLLRLVGGHQDVNVAVSRLDLHRVPQAGIRELALDAEVVKDLFHKRRGRA